MSRVTRIPLDDPNQTFDLIYTFTVVYLHIMNHWTKVMNSCNSKGFEV